MTDGLTTPAEAFGSGLEDQFLPAILLDPWIVAEVVLAEADNALTEETWIPDHDDTEAALDIISGFYANAYLFTSSWGDLSHDEAVRRVQYLRSDLASMTRDRVYGRFQREPGVFPHLGRAVVAVLRTLDAVEAPHASAAVAYDQIRRIRDLAIRVSKSGQRPNGPAD